MLLLYKQLKLRNQKILWNHLVLFSINIPGNFAVCLVTLLTDMYEWSLNSFSAKGNIEVFAINADSGDSARNESKTFKNWEMAYFEHGRVYFKQFGTERVKNMKRLFFNITFKFLFVTFYNVPIQLISFWVLTLLNSLL